MDTESGVEAYLNKQDFSTSKYDFRHPRTIEPIKGGTNNYKYRLSYSPEKGNRSIESAVLKYAAENATNDASKPLSLERQDYEAHAMRELAEAMKAQSDSEACIVQAPELQFYDATSRVMIMEDISPPPPPGESTADPLYVSLEKMCQRPKALNALDLIRRLGDELGRYLYRLHSLTLSTSEQPTARGLRAFFLPKSMNKEIDVQTFFRDVPAKLDRYGVNLSADQHAKLGEIIADMEQDYVGTQESVIMGNTSFGNIILKLRGEGGEKTLEGISIIDWELAACAPCYVDLAHYLSEIWLQDRFFPGPGMAAEVTQEAALSTFQSYLRAGGSIDPRRLVCYVGGHVACFVQYMDWEDHDGVKRAVAKEGALMMLHADKGDWDQISRNSPFMGKILKLLL